MAAAVSQVGQAGLDRAEHEMAEATGNAEHEAACFEPVIREARRMLAHLIDRTMRPGRQRWPGGFVSIAARLLLGQSLETPEGEQYPGKQIAAKVEVSTATVCRILQPLGLNRLQLLSQPRVAFSQVMNNARNGCTSAVLKEPRPASRAWREGGARHVRQRLVLQILLPKGAQAPRSQTIEPRPIRPRPRRLQRYASSSWQYWLKATHQQTRDGGGNNLNTWRNSRLRGCAIRFCEIEFLTTRFRIHAACRVQQAAPWNPWFSGHEQSSCPS
jgi:hypothetical protein